MGFGVDLVESQATIQIKVARVQRAALDHDQQYKGDTIVLVLGGVDIVVDGLLP